MGDPGWNGGCWRVIWPLLNKVSCGYKKMSLEKPIYNKNALRKGRFFDTLHSFTFCNDALTKLKRTLYFLYRAFFVIIKRRQHQLKILSTNYFSEETQMELEVFEPLEDFVSDENILDFCRELAITLRAIKMAETNQIEDDNEKGVEKHV